MAKRNTWDVRYYRTKRGAKRRLKQVQAMQPGKDFRVGLGYDFRYCVELWEGGKFRALVAG